MNLLRKVVSTRALSRVLLPVLAFAAWKNGAKAEATSSKFDLELPGPELDLAWKEIPPRPGNKAPRARAWTEPSADCHLFLTRDSSQTAFDAAAILAGVKTELAEAGLVAEDIELSGKRGALSFQGEKYRGLALVLDQGHPHLASCYWGAREPDYCQTSCTAALLSIAEER